MPNKLKFWIVAKKWYYIFFGLLLSSCIGRTQQVDLATMLMQKSDFNNRLTWLNERTTRDNNLIVNNAVSHHSVNRWFSGYLKDIENYVWIDHNLFCSPDASGYKLDSGRFDLYDQNYLPALRAIENNLFTGCEVNLKDDVMACASVAQFEEVISELSIYSPVDFDLNEIRNLFEAVQLKTGERILSSGFEC